VRVGMGMGCYDTYWLGRLQPHSLDSLVASLPRGSLSAQPLGVTRPQPKKGGREGINSHVGDPHTCGGVPGLLPVPVWGVIV
jgi:hypothetical protein